MVLVFFMNEGNFFEGSGEVKYTFSKQHPVHVLYTVLLCICLSMSESTARPAEISPNLTSPLRQFTCVHTYKCTGLPVCKEVILMGLLID